MRPAVAPAGTDSAVTRRSGWYGTTVTGAAAAMTLLPSCVSVCCPSSSTTAMMRYVDGTDVLAGMVTMVTALLLVPAARLVRAREPRPRAVSTASIWSSSLARNPARSVICWPQPSESVHDRYCTGKTTISCPAIRSNGRSTTGDAAVSGGFEHDSESASASRTKRGVALCAKEGFTQVCGCTVAA